jgi:hypothetical protein
MRVQAPARCAGRGSFCDITSKASGAPEGFESFMDDGSATFRTGDNRMAKLMPEAGDCGKRCQGRPS